MTGGVVGGAIGAAIGGFGGALVGTVGGPPGFVIIGGGGLAAGAAIGGFFGSAIGAGVGIGLGYDYCSADAAPTCDKPQDIVSPFPVPQSTPLLPPLGPNNPQRDTDKENKCWEKCKHLLNSPSGDRQSSEFRKCYRECMGTL